MIKDERPAHVQAIAQTNIYQPVGTVIPTDGIATAFESASRFVNYALFFRPGGIIYRSWMPLGFLPGIAKKWKKQLPCRGTTK